MTEPELAAALAALLARAGWRCKRDAPPLVALLERSS